MFFWSFSSCCLVLQYNVALPPMILSRFDLVYVMIDETDDQTDDHIADHIVRVHQKHEEALSPSFTTAQIQCYIAYAKTLKPKVVSLSHFELVFQFPKELLAFFASFQEPLTLLFTIDCLMP